jgi:hypothetical protein
MISVLFPANQHHSFPQMHALPFVFYNVMQQYEKNTDDADLHSLDGMLCTCTNNIALSGQKAVH